jgi:hypothetical protein
VLSRVYVLLRGAFHGDARRPSFGTTDACRAWAWLPAPEAVKQPPSSPVVLSHGFACAARCRGSARSMWTSRQLGVPYLAVFVLRGIAVTHGRTVSAVAGSQPCAFTPPLGIGCSVP